MFLTLPLKGWNVKTKGILSSEISVKQVVSEFPNVKYWKFFESWNLIDGSDSHVRQKVLISKDLVLKSLSSQQILK